MPRYGLRRLYLLLLVPIAIITVLFASKYPQLTEQYFSQGLYLIIVPALTSLSGLFFVSLAEVALIVGILSFLLYTARTVRAAVKDRDRRVYTLYTYVVNLCVIASVLYAGFVFLCGINYHRLPFADTAGLTVRDSSAAELDALCQELATAANAQVKLVSVGQDGTTTIAATDFEAATAAVNAMKNMSKDYPFMRGLYSVPKPAAFSSMLSYAHISGIYVPYTFEATYNNQVPDFSLPATMCHELAHQRGFMREDEANFIAYLACRSSENSYFNYAGTLHALSFSLNWLREENSERYYDMYESLDDTIKADFAAYNRFWQSHEGAVSQVSASVNNAYLMANSQSDGVQSYGRMVDLLLADYRARYSLN